MKKILFLIILLVVPFAVSAANDVDYEINQYYISSKIDIAGSMDVQEIIVLEGNFNGYERDILYKNSRLAEYQEGNINFANSAIYNGTDYTNLKVSAKYINDKISFDTFDDSFELFKETNNAYLGDKDVYELSSLTDGFRVRMYYPADNERVAFMLSYTILNVAVLHNDVAEVYWQFIGNDFADDIAEVKIRLLLPNPSGEENFKVWAHGSITGEVTRTLNEEGLGIGALAEMNDVTAGSEIDLRMTFDKDVIEIQNFAKKSNQDALSKILEVEQQRADETNETRLNMKKLYYLGFYGSIAYIVVLVFLWIFIYIKYDKEHKSNFKSKYYREFIEDYDVEVVDYLFNKSITPNAMSASIMNLIYKKNISVEEIINEKKPKNKDYKFTLLNEKNLSTAEKLLVVFLFETVGSKKTFTTKELKAYASATSTYKTFTSRYDMWKNTVITEGKSQNFFENIGSIRLVGIVYFIISVLLFIFARTMNINIFTLYACLPLGIVFMIYVLLFNKRTKKGNDDYVKWQAFKNFLLDFSILPQRELPEIILWQRYMVYAVVLGVADKVQKAMNVRITEVDPNNSYHTFSMFDIYMYTHLTSTLNTSVNTAVRESINKAVAESSSSSGDGFGGGFSGGGGFGGGGGGGRGF